MSGQQPGAEEGPGTSGERGLESSFASDASRFHHALGPEAIRLFSPNMRMLSLSPSYLLPEVSFLWEFS